MENERRNELKYLPGTLSEKPGFKKGNVLRQ